MSEEKDLDQIENDSSGSGGFGGLEDFVELDDLQNLEGLGDLSGLGDISDLGDLSDLQDIASEPAGLDDLDVNIDIPLPVMEEAEPEEQVLEADTAGGTAQGQEEEKITDIPVTDIPAEETVLPDAEEPGMPEKPESAGEILETVTEDDSAVPDSTDGVDITEELEEPEGLDMDIPGLEGIEEEPVPEETGIEEETLGIDVDSGEEEEALLDDIALDAGEEIVPEEEIVPGLSLIHI